MIIITMRKDILVEIMKRDILVEAAAVADADHTLQWKERMLERNAVHITKEHSMTELSLIEFVCGAGQMIKGFDAAVADMEVGQVVDIHLMPEEAYGMPNPEAIFTVEIAELPGSEDLEVGQQVYLSNQYGQPFPVKVTAKEETTITFDANHEMAGKELNFKIELVEVK